MNLNENPQVIVIGGSIFVAVFLLVVIATAFARFYRRPGADEALVRTGQGGNQVAIGEGIFVYPILHQLMRVSLRSIKLSVERSAKNALVTKDKIKANVTTELYVKVAPVKEDVLAAARSFGDRSLDEHAIGDLIEGKLTDALRSVAANQTFIELHSQRKQFAEHIQAALAEELSKNGLTLENVSITALAMVPVKDLDPHDVFDAEGLRAITDSVQSNAEKTNQIQREKEIAIHLQNVEARKRSLTMEQDQAQAEADQGRKVQEYKATQNAETAKAIYLQEQARETAAFEKQQAVEKARIAQEQAIAIAEAARQKAQREAQIATEKAQQAAEIAKQREIEAAMIEKEKAVQAAEIDRQKALEAATIEKQKVVEAAEIVKQQAIETARVAKQIAITQSEEQASRAAALKAQADAEQQQAAQGIITVEETAKANREKAIAIIKSEEAAQQSRIAAERDAFKKKLEAETAAAAVKATAEGEASAKKAQADGEIARAQGVARSQELQAQAAAKVVQIEVTAEADRIRISAEAKAKAAQQEAEAMMALAEALRKRGEAEAFAKQKLVEAENSVATKFLMRDIAVKALDVLPSVTRELMQPAKAISEIKVLQLQGAAGASANGDANGAGSMFGSASPILKTIMEAGAAYPLLREMLTFAQVDTDKLADKVRAFVGTLPDEVRAAVDADPELQGKLAEITRRVQDTTIEPVSQDSGA
ncbi:MAG: flotillin domain-containing protein [Polyangiaceae bacterium]